MKTALWSLAIAVVAVTFTSEVASADGGKSGGGKSGSFGSKTGSSGSTKTFSSHGHNYSFHHYSRDYRGWSQYCWFPSYGCYGYYSSADLAWYYWYEPQHCYLPVTVINVYPPVNPGFAPASPTAQTSINLPSGATTIPTPAPAVMPPKI